jgi:beta-phosphoglucomutase
MLRSIIFDFNGVILNDEPLHHISMKDSVAELGIVLTREAYWAKYLPLDDASCLASILRDFHLQLSDEQKRNLLERKVQLYRKLIKDSVPLFPGAAQFVKKAAQFYPLAIASGARRQEIESVLDAAGLRRYFRSILAAEDFIKGKPHPESFLQALARLNSDMGGSSSPIKPGECLVIEDSVDGVRGARLAGMVCLAVSNTYPTGELREANKVVSSMENLQPDILQKLFHEPAKIGPVNE